MGMAENNPHGANQYQSDPRQTNFLARYMNPDSETYSNALQSALAAGYAQEYAENILNLRPTWLSDAMESLIDTKRLKKAEAVLDRILNEEPVDAQGGRDNQLLKTQADVGKFFAKTLNKKKYSERIEQTGADGKDLIPDQTSIKIAEAAISSYLQK